MQQQFNNMLKILSALVGRAPAKRIAADREMFPLVCCLPLVGYHTSSSCGTLNMFVLHGEESH